MSVILILMMSLSEVCYGHNSLQEYHQSITAHHRGFWNVKSHSIVAIPSLNPRRKHIKSQEDSNSLKDSYDIQRDDIMNIAQSLRGGDQNGRKKKLLPSFRSTLHFFRVIGITYITFYKAMVMFGPLKFIFVVNIAVFGLWTLSSVLMFLVDFRNSTEMYDIREVKKLFPKGKLLSIKEGEKVIIPKGYVLIFCDNGWADPIMIRKVFDTETDLHDRRELIQKHRRKDKIRLLFVKEMDYADYIHENSSHWFWDSLLNLALFLTGKDYGHDLKIEYQSVGIKDDQSFVFPENSILVDFKDGLPDSFYDSNIKRNVRRQIVSQDRTDEISLSFASEDGLMSAYRLFRRKRAIRDRKRFFHFSISGVLEHCIAPYPWRELVTKPLSVFFSAFSHMGIDHLSSNLAALHVVGPTVLHRLGASVFSHLYLMCILASTLVSCAWSEVSSNLLNRKTDVLGSLGASGAISGILGWYYLSSSRHEYVMVGNNKVKPLTVLVVFILSDVCGLLELTGLAHILEKILLSEGKSFAHVIDWIFEGDNYKKMKGKSEKNIGFANHLGGYLFSVLFYLMVSKKNIRNGYYRY